MIGLGGFDLRLGAGSLGADVGVVELQQKLALVHMIAFLDRQALYRRGDGSVRFEAFVLNRFNLSVGRNEAADWTAFDPGRPHFERGLVQIRVQQP